MPEKSYALTAIVKRTVLDTITLNVKAQGISEAKLKAEYALGKFPEAHDLSEISYMFIENREAVESELVSLDRRKVV